MIWGLMIPPLTKKLANFYQFKSRSVSKVVFFLIFEPILRAGFFDKMLGLSSKTSTFVLVSGLSAALFSQFCSNII